MKTLFKLLLAGAFAAVSAFSAASAAEKKIGVVVPTLDAQFWNSYVDFMKKGAGELGVDLVVLNADNKPDQMVKSLEDLVAQGVDGIIFTPYWATAVPGLTLANQANIPVILTDTYADFPPQTGQFPNYVAFIGPSDRDAGKQMAEALFAALQPSQDGKKHIAVVNGTSGTSVAIDRRAGLEDALKEHPEVVVAGEVDGNFVRDTSQTVFESLWQGHPEVQGVWAANGGTATGVMAAITSAGKTPGKDIIVVGMDLNPENVDAVEQGKLLFDIGGHWLQGGFALVTMYDYLNGHKVSPENANIKLKLLPLTRDRVAQFRTDFPGGVPAYDFKAHSLTFSKDAKSAVFEMKYSK
ncbi:ABC-type sugar transport system substrate-binding protein [Rhizobium sp. BK313]|uniref:ABC transporter substrate-binding protein n=1 Tax=Rhizobium sp. BK313 TaxID=2587081 RepID=UPI0010E308A8|nr:ABC transporter substrate-binding protein [Rhizobium sp. BK313]MBB3459372.1 ABC-type sugar transport system substrate-binding protein [Rhizobium sp. BK313]